MASFRDPLTQKIVFFCRRHTRLAVEVAGQVETDRPVAAGLRRLKLSVLLELELVSEAVVSTGLRRGWRLWRGGAIQRPLARVRAGSEPRRVAGGIDGGLVGCCDRLADDGGTSEEKR